MNRSRAFHFRPGVKAVRSGLSRREDASSIAASKLLDDFIGLSAIDAAPHICPLPVRMKIKPTLSGLGLARHDKVLI